MRDYSLESPHLIHGKAAKTPMKTECFMVPEVVQIYLDPVGLFGITISMCDENAIDILQEALSVGKLLAGSGITWAFAGGIAVGIHGYVRATEDVDNVIDRATE